MSDLLQMNINGNNLNRVPKVCLGRVRYFQGYLQYKEGYHDHISHNWFPITNNGINVYKQTDHFRNYINKSDPNSHHHDVDAAAAAAAKTPIICWHTLKPSGWLVSCQA